MKWKIIGILVCMLFISSVFTSAIQVKIDTIDEEKSYSSSFEIDAINYDDEETFINKDEPDYSTSSYKFSKYFGNEDMPLTEGSGFFDTYQDENGVWWLVDPDGYAFFATGRWGDPDLPRLYRRNILEKYGSYEQWANETRKNITSWGFNTFKVSLRNLHLFEKEDERIPYVHRFFFQHMGTGLWNRLIKKVIPDVFNPYFWELVEQNISEVTARLKNDSYLIGYFLGNEMHWDSSPIKGFDEDTLLETYLSMPEERFQPGKDKVVWFLKNQYENNGGLEAFNNVWNMNLTFWDELYDKEKLGREGWRIVSCSYISKQKLLKDNPDLKNNPKYLVQAEHDIRNFTRLVAKWFFKNVTEILHKYDSNHLTLGVRFYAWGASREVIEECAEYCNITSINYYRDNLFLASVCDQLDYYFASRKKGLVPIKNWMKNYYEITNKPILIAEWGRGWKTEKSGPFGIITVGIDHDEEFIANYNAEFTNKSMQQPYIIGVMGHYSDNTYGHHISANLVNVTDHPYQLVVAKLKELNSKVYEIHRNSWKNI